MLSLQKRLRLLKLIGITSFVLSICLLMKSISIKKPASFSPDQMHKDFSADAEDTAYSEHDGEILLSDGDKRFLKLKYGKGEDTVETYDDESNVIPLFPDVPHDADGFKADPQEDTPEYIEDTEHKVDNEFKEKSSLEDTHKSTAAPFFHPPIPNTGKASHGHGRVIQPNFQGIFPDWHIRNRVREINRTNMKNKISPSIEKDLLDVLAPGGTQKGIDLLKRIKLSRRHKNQYTKNRNQSTTPKPTEKPLFKKWHEYTSEQCSGHFIGYSYEFAYLKDVVVTKEFAIGQAGGEEMSKVMGQDENKEYYKLLLKFYQLKCVDHPKYFFNGENHLNKWLKILYTDQIMDTSQINYINDQFTIAVTRYEYVNLYHIMTDFYNAFLVMKFLGRTRRDTNILILDAHPKGSLDPPWSVLFNSSIRLNSLPKVTLFKHLVWGIQGYNSPLSKFEVDSLPYAEEFRQHFLTNYNISEGHTKNCNQINILFIWRRNYVAHPRNPMGTIGRKIKNEREMMRALKKRYPSFHIKGVQLDKLPMTNQLGIISSTDILIGMHGAGLTMSLFLPKHAGLLEFYPIYYSNSNVHFAKIAQWRNLTYEQWVNSDSQNELPDMYTNIPTEVLLKKTKIILSQLCPKHTDTDTQKNIMSNEIL